MYKRGRECVCVCVFVLVQWMEERVCVSVCGREREGREGGRERERKKNIQNALLNRRRSFSAASGREKPI